MGTDGTFTIRTGIGQLFGSFDSREDAWAAVERVRKSDQAGAVDGVAVVPLLDGVAPKPMHPKFLSDDYEGPSKPQYLIDIEQLRAERDQYREHSITLNSVTFAIAEALGLVPPGADCAQGDPLELARRLIGSLERRTAQLDEASAEVERLTERLREAQDRPWQNQ